MLRGRRSIVAVLAFAVVGTSALGSCGGGDDEQVSALQAQVTELQDRLDATQRQLDSASSDLDRVSGRARAAWHQGRGMNQCILSVQHAAVEMGKARDYLAYGGASPLPFSDVSLSACRGLLSASAIIDLKHLDAVMQEAVKSAETNRGGGS